MSHKPLVSTVIICFNSEKFLSDAIASVIAQTYDNWELLLVDDGSTDNSPGIMQDYVAQYPQKIRYLEHPNHQNRGKNASRNLGINHAQGEYIALLDSDDAWLTHKLEQQVAILDQYPEAGMVYGRNYTWYSEAEKSTVRGRCQPSRYPLGVEPNNLIPPPTLLLLLLKGVTQTPTTCNPLIRKEVCQQVGLFDENFRDVFEDQDFFAKVLHTVPVFVSDEFWAKYRQHQDSSMNLFDSVTRKDVNIRYKKRLHFLKSVKKFLSQQEMSYPEVWNCLDERISRLQRKLWLSHILSIFYINTWWSRFLDLTMWIGRRILPFAWRDWLWKKMGDRLY